MTLRVQDFRSRLIYDGARPNLFKCELTFPFGVGEQRAQTEFTFMARAAQMPGDTIGQVPIYFQGRELKHAGNRVFTEWTVTLYNDEDHVVKNAFERWMSGMNSHVGNLRDPSFIMGDGGYQQDAYITHLGKRGDAIKRYKFIGMFPIDVTPVEVDWGANDTIEEYAVTFAYQWWESDTTDAVGTNIPLSPLLTAIP